MHSLRGVVDRPFAFCVEAGLDGIQPAQFDAVDAVKSILVACLKSSHYVGKQFLRTGLLLSPQGNVRLAHERLLHVRFDGGGHVHLFGNLNAHEDFVRGCVITHLPDRSHRHALEEHARAFLDPAHLIEGRIEANPSPRAPLQGVIQRANEQHGGRDNEQHEHQLVKGAE